MKALLTVALTFSFLTLTISPGYPQGAGTEWDKLIQEVETLEREGQHDHAVVVAKKALELAEKNLGPDHPDVATSLNSLAELYRSQARSLITGKLWLEKDCIPEPLFEQAEPHYRRALAIREKSLGPDHPDVATSLNNLAELLKLKGRLLTIRKLFINSPPHQTKHLVYVTAEPLLNRALDIREKALGPDHPDVATSLNNIAELYTLIEDKKVNALQLHERALAIREKALGPNHLDVATSLYNLARIIIYDKDRTPLERIEKAINYYKGALGIQEKALGPDHPDVVISMYKLANFRDTHSGRNKIKKAEAESLYKQVLSLSEKTFGANHPITDEILYRMASFYRLENQWAQAALLSKRSLDIREKALGPDNTMVFVALLQLITTYEEQRLYSQAVPYYKRTLAIAEKILGPQNHYANDLVHKLARFYYEQEQYGKAEPLYKRALAFQMNINSDKAIFLKKLAKIYRATQRDEEAALLEQRAEDIIANLDDDELSRVSEEAIKLKRFAENSRAIQRDKEAALLEQRAEDIIAYLDDYERSRVNGRLNSPQSGQADGVSKQNSP